MKRMPSVLLMTALLSSIGLPFDASTPFEAFNIHPIEHLSEHTSLIQTQPCLPCCSPVCTDQALTTGLPGSAS